ncbi:uncharacterized protein J8A68_003635 [[Candida] subhashii]|uniref:Proteasome assembly chaperone 2 n=1 Tax=[Candida] subhashii TaxID=561895 RepID=A0A8J5QLV7_9ASCO|nr:uncharacterized protein J8A68_003635 [[Candida] subhashii]KAG7662865.1 hypothetical protein J8A68_003635 [[Candida] subhashii]
MEQPFISSTSSPESSFVTDTTTLIIPSISIGNIPQLTIDLFIHTYNLIKVGTLNDLYVYPFASPIDYSNNHGTVGLSNAIEVYHNPQLKITLIQQRSPILPSFTESYVIKVIIPFIQSLTQLTKVLILDSSDAGLFEHVQAGDIELYTTEVLLSKSLESLELSSEKVYDDSKKENNDTSNYVRSLLKALNFPRIIDTTNDVNYTFDVNVLVSFVYEGDNFYDGEKLATKTAEVLKLNIPTIWTRPISWFGAYGDKPIPNSMEEGLFG